MNRSIQPTLSQFKKIVWSAYAQNRRDSLPWRKMKDPYKILVSELMLQQTQVERVIPKYEAFIKRFPTIESLAKAQQSAVLTSWQGLGYNRRALYLKKTCEILFEQSQTGLKQLKKSNNVKIDFVKFPSSFTELVALPGIGQSTAGAIMNFAFNKPQVFIETNIRTVYLHHFFKNTSSVSDTDIQVLIDKTLDQKNPREWFYALYDYGTVLKKELGKQKTVVHKQSKHYTKQSTFKGSDRQIRGQILAVLLTGKTTAGMTIEDMRKKSEILAQGDADTIQKNLSKLVREGFIRAKGLGRAGKVVKKFAIL